MTLIMHAGGRNVDFDEVSAVETPAPTATHFPISHAAFAQTVCDSLDAVGMTIEDCQHGLWGENGERYFALARLQDRTSDYSTVVGFRNSHDKKFSAQMSLGNRVFVCDNLSFFGDVVLARKHTRYVVRDLAGLVHRATNRMVNMADAQRRTIELYKEAPMVDMQFHDLAIRSVDTGVMPASKLPKVLHEWRDSEHTEFHDRTCWSAFNAFTEVMKGTSQATLSTRTQKLHNLIKSFTTC